MRTAGMKLFILFLLVGLTHEYNRKVRENSAECANFARAVLKLMEPNPVNRFPYRCMLGRISQALVGRDYSDYQQLESAICLIVDNSATVGELFTALDEKGYIDEILRILYSGISIGAGQGLASIRNVPLRLRVNKCSNTTDPYAHLRDATYDFAEVDPDVFVKLVDTFIDLGVFTLDSEYTKLLKQILGPIVYGSRSRTPPDSEGCGCSRPSLIPVERCRLAKEAVRPIIDHIVSHKYLLQDYMQPIIYLQNITGVILINDFKTDALQLICQFAQMESLSDVRKLLDDVGMSQPLLKAAIGYLSYNVDYIKKRANRTVATFEAEDEVYWRPSEQDADFARTQIAFAEAYEEAGLMCLSKISYANRGAYIESCEDSIV